MRQILISKDHIAKELKADEITLREVYRFCDHHYLKLVTHDQYFIIVEDARDEEYFRYEVRHNLEKIGKHFSDNHY